MGGKNAAIIGFRMDLWKALFKLISCTKKDETIPHLRDTVEPELILWENLGLTIKEKRVRLMSVLSLCIVLLVISFISVYAIKEQELEANNWHKSECRLLKNINYKSASDDIIKPLDQQKGFMWCYCQQQFEKSGMRALDITFLNGQSYCKKWHSLAYPGMGGSILALTIALLNFSFAIIFNCKFFIIFCL